MKKVYDGDVGYEIRGFSDPLFNRKPLRRNDSDLKLEIPNGDLEHGRRVYTSSCATCHELGILIICTLNLFRFGPISRSCYEDCIFKKNWI